MTPKALKKYITKSPRKAASDAERDQYPKVAQVCKYIERATGNQWIRARHLRQNKHWTAYEFEVTPPGRMSRWDEPSVMALIDGLKTIIPHVGLTQRQMRQITGQYGRYYLTIVAYFPKEEVAFKYKRGDVFITKNYHGYHLTYIVATQMVGKKKRPWYSYLSCWIDIQGQPQGATFERCMAATVHDSSHGALFKNDEDISRLTFLTVAGAVEDIVLRIITEGDIEIKSRKLRSIRPQVEMLDQLVAELEGAR